MENREDILKIDTAEKRELKEQAFEELRAEGAICRVENVQERYLNLYYKKHAKKEVEKMEEIREVIGCGMVKDWTDEQLQEAFRQNGLKMKKAEMIIATVNAENQVMWYEAIERKIQLVSPGKGFDPLSPQVNIDMGGAVDTPADAEAPNDAVEEPSDPAEYRTAGTGDVDMTGGVE